MDATASRCCGAVIEATPGVVETNICAKCKLVVTVVHMGVCEDIEHFLLDLSKPPGSSWLQVAQPKESAIYYVLSQLLYCPDLLKGEVPYDTPDDDDIVKLVWYQQAAVGFYTVKPQGARRRSNLYIDGLPTSSGLPTLDTAFILPSHRRTGLGMGLLQDFVSSYPDLDLAFSYPLSDAMWMVLKKYLVQHVGMRRKLWLVKGYCEEGNKTLIWYCLMKQKLLGGDQQNC